MSDALPKRKKKKEDREPEPGPRIVNWKQLLKTKLKQADINVELPCLQVTTAALRFTLL